MAKYPGKNNNTTSDDLRKLRAWERDACKTCGGYGRAASGRSWLTCWTCRGTGRRKQLSRFPLDNARTEHDDAYWGDADAKDTG